MTNWIWGTNPQFAFQSEPVKLLLAMAHVVKRDPAGRRPASSEPKLSFWDTGSVQF